MLGGDHDGEVGLRGHVIVAVDGRLTAAVATYSLGYKVHVEGTARW